MDEVDDVRHRDENAGKCDGTVMQACGNEDGTVVQTCINADIDNKRRVRNHRVFLEHMTVDCDAVIGPPWCNVLVSGAPGGGPAVWKRVTVVSVSY